MQFKLHPRQSEVFISPARQVLFGGAAGPGKSYALRVAAIAWATAIKNLQIYFFRRLFPDLYRNHMEGPNGFPMMLMEWLGAGRVKINHSTNEISFSNGSKILLAHMQYEKDIDRIQGAEIHVAMIDELTQFTKSQYAFIRSRVRMTGIDVPRELEGRFPRILTASNPTGAGHNWVKSLFVDPVPPGDIWKSPPEEGGMTTQFIPARIQDNPTLLEEDPGYMERLQGLNNPTLVRAMLDGDWNVTSGGMFDDLWGVKSHVIEPFKVPHSWPIYRAFDWGSSKPFSVGWWAISDGTPAPTGRKFPPGSLFRVAEWYGWNGKPNEGLRMVTSEIARKILKTEEDMGYKIRPGPADLPSAQDGMDMAADFGRMGVGWCAIDSKSRVAGWQQMRKMLLAAKKAPMEDPGLFVFETCRQFIRTVPVLPRDLKNSDDVDSSSEDHVGDEARYMTMFKPKRAGTVAVSGI